MHVSNATATNSSNNTNKSNQVYLKREQVEKLKHVLDRLVPICSSPGTSSSPTLHISPRAFLRQVLHKFRENHIDIEHVRLNGGAASYVLVNDRDFVYRDIDILFYIRTPLSSDKQTTLFSSNQQTYSCDVWTLIKYIVCSCLLEHIHNATSADEQKQQQYTHHYLSTVLETYAKKIIKISSDQDSWALLSLQNPNGQNLEFKFVEHLKRQWQFSVDSFQINLEPLIHEKDTQSSHLCKCPSISSITQTIRTKSLVIDAINGLTIIKKQHDEQKENSQSTVISTSPIQFGFFTPSSSPAAAAAVAAAVATTNDSIGRENHIECQTLATITTIATSTSSQPNHQGRTRLPKNSHSANHDEFNSVPLQFHLSLHDDTDDGIVSDADDSVTEDDDQVFRTPVDNNSAPASPATIIALDVLTLPSAPIIEVHSAYPDLQQALDHLQKKLIATYAPETMRGGGLLKYCDLLAQNYKVHDVTDMLRMQRYMCSRFFIDYKTIPEQIHVINQYITTHFLPLAMNNNPLEFTVSSNYLRRSSSSHSNLMTKIPEQINLTNARLCLLFFDHLLAVIQHSTVCLTHHDKELTLLSINQLREGYHYHYEYLFVGDQYHYQRYHVHAHVNQHQHCSSSSSNSSRSSSPSSSSSNSYRYYRQPHHRQNHLQYRPNHHHHNNNNHHPQRQGNQNNSSATSVSSYHHHHHSHHNHHHHSSSRNYSNDLNSNVPSSLINHYHHRRHQS